MSANCAASRCAHLGEGPAGFLGRRLVELHLARDGVELGVVARRPARRPRSRRHWAARRWSRCRAPRRCARHAAVPRRRTAPARSRADRGRARSRRAGWRARCWRRRAAAREAAACSIDRSKRSAIGCEGALRGARRRAVMRPPRKAVGRIVPITICASVIAGSVPPRAVAGGAGIGAGALRADPQHAAVVDPGDRAAARADRDDVEHRRADRQAVDLAFRGERGAAVLHQADVGRGAAHVEGDQVLEARARRLARRADHAGGRARNRAR